MSDERDTNSVEEDVKAWQEGIQGLRTRLAEEAPEHLGRVDDLVRLRGNLPLSIDAIESSLEGYDPDDEYPEGVFGDTFLEETVGLMVTLPELLTSLGLEPGGMRRVVHDGMELQVRYDSELESVSLSTGERSEAWYLLDDPSGAVVGITADHGVVHVRVPSEMLPLHGPRYDPATDVPALRDPSSGAGTPAHFTGLCGAREFCGFSVIYRLLQPEGNRPEKWPRSSLAGSGSSVHPTMQSGRGITANTSGASQVGPLRLHAMA